MQWQCSSYSFDTRMPILMGILNVTPDSFSDGGSYLEYDKAIAHAWEMVEEGAQIIDVGGESTRPGSREVSPEEEIGNTQEIVRELAAQNICVSIDTRHVEVARAAIEAGASIINDISGFRDPAMFELAVQSDAGLVLMHMRGTPETMQDNTDYLDVVVEVGEYLKNQAAALESAGVDARRICIDPGPGFGKTTSQSHELMRNMHEFARLGYPLMAAVSRKAFIGKAYHIEEASMRDEASAKEALYALELGAGVVRTHNVSCTAEALKDFRPYVFLGLGSNVALVAEPGEEREAKIAQLNHAISSLSALPDSQLIDLASFYESEPAYYEDQDSFVNTVALMRTGLPPKELLTYIHAIENSLGRVRTIENGPRTCDIDILDYQQYVCKTDVLELPHPRIQERDFVVKPLLEIRPRHILANGRQIRHEDVSVGTAYKIED